MKPSIDEMWREVKKFYESNYKGIRFASRPSDRKIVFLYEEMVKLKRSWAFHQEKVRDNLHHLM